MEMPIQSLKRSNSVSETHQGQEHSFESALHRLEQILEKMHSGAVPLEESLKLYEEADQLIASCNKKLSDAEKKIQILIKNRSGEPLCGPDGKPLLQPFSSSNGK
jgi:exodeoxyribonuclease VII small subunit